LRDGTPPAAAHFFWISGCSNHFMKFSASAWRSDGAYFEMCMPMPPSGTKSASWVGSVANPSFSRISSRDLPSVDCFGSSSPPIAATQLKPTQTLPWATAALTSSMNQLPEPLGASGFISLTSTSIAFLPASSLMTPSICLSSAFQRLPP
jgi:hypothetical protein